MAYCPLPALASYDRFVPDFARQQWQVRAAEVIYNDWFAWSQFRPYGGGGVRDVLIWAVDEWSEYSENADAIIAEDGDFTFHIWSVRGRGEDILGYRIYVGNIESGYWPRGSVEIDGEPGELTLDEAKAVAEAEVQSQLDGVNNALKVLVSGWKDDTGNARVHFDTNGAMLYSINDDVEIRIFAGTDHDDWFDPAKRFWSVGWNNLHNHPDQLESILQQQIAEHAVLLGLSSR